MDEPPRLPPETRPRALAGVELVLDLMHLLREATGLDHESIMILCAMNSAAMRPLLFDAKTPDSARDLAEPPNEMRGSMSRLAIADVTGLARETVRRKVNRLIELGMAEEDEQSHVRPTRQLADPRWQTIADQGFAAVQRYDRKLRGLGCKGVGD
jgi:hypothetical protein